MYAYDAHKLGYDAKYAYEREQGPGVNKALSLAQVPRKLHPWFFEGWCAAGYALFPEQHKTKRLPAPVTHTYRRDIMTTVNHKAPTVRL